EISEFEWPQERNGRAGCADGHRLPSIRRKTHECGERTKPLELRSDSRLSGKKILANLSPEGEDLLIGSQRLRALSQAQKQRPRTKEHAYIRRYYHVSKATVPEGIDVALLNMGSPKPIRKTYSVT